MIPHCAGSITDPLSVSFALTGTKKGGPRAALEFGLQRAAAVDA